MRTGIITQQLKVIKARSTRKCIFNLKFGSLTFLPVFQMSEFWVGRDKKYTLSNHLQTPALIRCPDIELNAIIKLVPSLFW